LRRSRPCRYVAVNGAAEKFSQKASASARVIFVRRADRQKRNVATSADVADAKNRPLSAPIGDGVHLGDASEPANLR
jgi:hypothetical protein